LEGRIRTSIVWLIASVLLWVAVLLLGFLLLGALRALDLLRWRLEQLEATGGPRAALTDGFSHST
jgi:hypothetical protein